MNNHEIIKVIEEIVQPYFTFEMDDFYGDRGGIPYPKIENLKRLYFKKHDKKLILSKNNSSLSLVIISFLSCFLKYNLFKFSIFG